MNQIPKNQIKDLEILKIKLYGKQKRNQKTNNKKNKKRKQYNSKRKRSRTKKHTITTKET